MIYRPECKSKGPACKTNTNNRNYKALMHYLSQDGISLNAVKPVVNSNVIAGYMITFSEDIYTRLKRHTVEL